MRTCSFYGTKTPVTEGFYRELVKNIDRMTLREPVEFLFFAHDPFQFSCLAAALEVKQRRKEKVCLTLLAWADETHFKNAEIRMPMAVFDTVIPVRTVGKYAPQKVEQAMLRRSDLVILGQQSALPPAGPRTRRISLDDANPARWPSAAPVACTVLLPGPTRSSVARREVLAEMVDFMIRGLGVTHFPEEVPQDQIRPQFVPPFDDLLNLDPQVDAVRNKFIRTVKFMLERSHYVLCDRNTLEKPMAQRIEKYRHIKLLDIGKFPLVGEFLVL